eukprot:m.38698 g.38698  ORF g.38698 m.38698 type:complete len:128 (-) comp45330_c0_seq1:192-575(-)
MWKSSSRRIGRSTSELSVLEPSLLGTLDSQGVKQQPVALQPLQPTGRKEIKLSLGDTNLTFQDGSWTADGGAVGPGDGSSKKLKKENKQLREQNNLLQCKIDILIDLLAASRMDVQQMREELIRASK